MKFFFLLSPLFFFSVTLSATEVSDYSAAGITITPLGSDGELRVAREEEVARFRLRNGSENRKRIALQKITFKNYGKSDLTRSFESPFITMNGQIVSTQFSAEKKYITFIFEDNTIINAGDTKIFSVKAIISYARTGDTLQIGIARQEDLEATEVGTGFQVGFAAPIYFKTHTLRSGDLSFLRDWRSQAQKAETKFLQNRIQTHKKNLIN